MIVVVLVAVVIDRKLVVLQRYATCAHSKKKMVKERKQGIFDSTKVGYPRRREIVTRID